MKRFLTLALLGIISTGLSHSAVSRATMSDGTVMETKPVKERDILQTKVNIYIAKLREALDRDPAVQRMRELVEEAKSKLSPEQLRHFTDIAHEIIRNARGLVQEKKHELIELVNDFKKQAVEIINTNKERVSQASWDVADPMERQQMLRSRIDQNITVREFLNHLERENSRLYNDLKNYFMQLTSEPQMAMEK